MSCLQGSKLPSPGNRIKLKQYNYLKLSFECMNFADFN